MRRSIQLALIAAGLTAAVPAAMADHDPHDANDAIYLQDERAYVGPEGRYRPDWGYTDGRRYYPGGVHAGKAHGRGYYHWRNYQVAAHPAVQHELYRHAAAMQYIAEQVHIARATGRWGELDDAHRAMRRELNRHERKMYRLRASYPYRHAQPHAPGPYGAPYGPAPYPYAPGRDHYYR